MILGHIAAALLLIAMFLTGIFWPEVTNWIKRKGRRRRKQGFEKKVNDFVGKEDEIFT